MNTPLTYVLVLLAAIVSFCENKDIEWILMEECYQEQYLAPGDVLHVRVPSGTETILRDCELLIKSYPDYVLGYSHTNGTDEDYDDSTLKDYILDGFETQISVRLKRKDVWRESEVFSDRLSKAGLFRRRFEIMSFLADTIAFSIHTVPHSISPSWPMTFSIEPHYLAELFNIYGDGEEVEMIQHCKATFVHRVDYRDTIYVHKKGAPMWPAQYYASCEVHFNKTPNVDYSYRYKPLVKSHRVTKHLKTASIKMYYLNQYDEYVIFLHLKSEPEGAVVEELPPDFIYGLKYVFDNPNKQEKLGYFAFGFRLSSVRFHKTSHHLWYSYFNELIPFNPLSGLYSGEKVLNETFK